MQHSGYSYTSTSENSAEAKFAELVFHALRGGDPNIRGGATTAWVPLPGVAAHPTPQPSRSPRSRGRLVEADFPFSAIVTRLLAGTTLQMGAPSGINGSAQRKGWERPVDFNGSFQRKRNRILPATRPVFPGGGQVAYVVYVVFNVFVCMTGRKDFGEHSRS